MVRAPSAPPDERAARHLERAALEVWIGYAPGMTDAATAGLWIVLCAAGAGLSCNGSAEPVASAGTSAQAVTPTPTTETLEPQETSPQDDSNRFDRPPAKACAADAVQAVRSISVTHCEVPRSVFLDDRDCLLAQPQLTPHRVEGRVVGFRHDSVPSRSVYAACGIRSGDVWTKLNGERLDSADQALRLYPSLRESQQLQIELLRGAQSLQVVIDLRTS